jgi:hypothetical protein
MRSAQSFLSTSAVHKTTFSSPCSCRVLARSTMAVGKPKQGAKGAKRGSRKKCVIWPVFCSSAASNIRSTLFRPCDNARSRMHVSKLLHAGAVATCQSTLALTTLSWCRAVDPFLKKEWYDVKAPSMFSTRQVGKTLITRTQGTKVRGLGRSLFALRDLFRLTSMFSEYRD